MIKNLKNKIYSIIINRKILQWLPLSWIVIFFVSPIILVTAFSFISIDFQNGFAINFSFENIFFLFNKFYLNKATNSILISFFSAILASIFGFYLAYFSAFLRSKIRYLILLLISFTFSLNPIILFQSINFILSENGLLNNLLLTKLFNNSVNIPDFCIILICYIYKFIPIVYFFSITSLKKTDSSIIESALDLGASRFFIFFKIIVKNSKKNIFLSFLIVFFLCLGNISIPISSNYGSNFLAGMVFNEFLMNFKYSFIASQLFPFCILIILFSISYNEYFNTHKNFLHFYGNKKFAKYKCISIGKEPPAVIINTFLIVFFIFSILILILFSFNENILTEKFNKNINFWNGFSLNWYYEIFSRKDILIAFKNTFIISAFASFISTIFGTMLALSSSKFKDLQNHSFLKFISLPFIISEVTIGISLALILKFFGFSDNILIPIICLSAFSIFFSTIIIYTQIQKIDKNVEDSSLDLGANYVQTFFKVTFPAIIPIISSCFLVTFAFVLNEFSITYLTFGKDFPTLSSKLLGLSTGNSLIFNAVSTLLILVTIFSILVGYLFNSYKKSEILIKYFLIIFVLLIAILLLFI